MALLPPFTLDAVMAIGVGDDEAKRRWVGTGFLYGLFDKKLDETTKSYRVFLVTNKHVLKGKKRIYLKFNSANDSISKDYPVDLLSRNGKVRWVGHANDKVDVAVMPVNANALKDELMKYAFFQSDSHICSVADMKKLGVTEGTRVFVLGFPMGLVDKVRQYVICRAGCIARIRDLLEGTTKDFMVDATVFPGNSGGPVIFQPEVAAITGTTAITKADLIGVVKSYVPYHDVALSQQTGSPRIIFEENSGLAAVEPVDHITEAIQLALKRQKNRMAYSKWKAKKQAVGTPASPASPAP
jgi:S1-C subfamily serine protease